MGVATSHSGNGRVLQGMVLLNNVTSPQFAALQDFIEDSFERIDLSNPQAYLVYCFFDERNMMLDPRVSGILQVGDPDELARLEPFDIMPSVNGFFYTYVTNRSAGKVSFDNLRVRHWQPKVRVQYDYYPYGLPWENPATTGEDALHDYLYQDKEFQFSEFSDGSGLALYDFHARMYDPATATWSVPDPAGQFSNPYLAMGNNPVTMIDPDGEWVQFAIGAAVGGFSGWQIGKANGATGWEMFGYIAGGAAIGAASGGVATGVSAAGGGAFIAGASAGAVGGGGFAALGGGNAGDIAKGAAFGFISGGIGGSFGAAIGGGGGAFAGGAVGSGLNTALHGGNIGDVGMSALMGGGMAFGVYHASSYIGWKFQGGNKWGDVDISYRQYTAMQADFQRSRFWGREYGGYLLENRRVYKVPPGTNSQIDMGKVPDGAFAEYHTHWDKPGQIRYVDDAGNYVNPERLAAITPVGEKVRVAKFTTSRYHGDWDFDTRGLNSFVINRYDGSYYPGHGSYSVINPSINRFVWSFYFWR